MSQAFYCALCGSTTAPCVHLRDVEGYAVPRMLESVADREIKQLRAQLAKLSAALTDANKAAEAIAKQRDAALAENEEQARLLGMGSEREARLIAQLAEAQRELERKSSELRAANHSLNGWKERAEKAEAELAAEKARADRLEAAIRNAPHWGGCAMFNAPNGSCNCWKCEALEGK